MERTSPEEEGKERKKKKKGKNATKKKKKKKKARTTPMYTWAFWSAQIELLLLVFFPFLG